MFVKIKNNISILSLKLFDNTKKHTLEHRKENDNKHHVTRINYAIGVIKYEYL
jgi:hypothetical protein